MIVREYTLNLEQIEQIIRNLVDNEVGFGRRDGKVAFELYSHNSLKEIKYVLEDGEEGAFSLYVWKDNSEDSLDDAESLLEQIAKFKLPKFIKHKVENFSE